MASREQLSEINKARAGDASAQISLAKRYLSGERGLAKNEATALLWLKKAAQQGSLDACIVMGSYISTGTAQHSQAPELLLPHYKRAFSAGVDAAGLTFAELVLMQVDQKPDLLIEVQTILEILARKNIAEAQWLLVTTFCKDQLSGERQHQALTTSDGHASLSDSSYEPTQKNIINWTTGAAIGGIPEARSLLAERAWADKDYDAFLQWMLPEAEKISQHHSLEKGCAPTPPTEIPQLQSFRKELLYRCATCLCYIGVKDSEKAVHYLKLAASEGNCLAQLSLGLWFAKMNSHTAVLPLHPKRANFEQAVKWLTSAGAHGLAAAWYALSKIYLKATFVGRSVAQAERFLEHAAELGHCEAQLELGIRAWRMRHNKISSDVKAAFWLQKAASQGCNEAEGLLEKIAPRAREEEWAMEMLPLLTLQARRADPFLAMRIELAALIGLSKLEALWLDIHVADQGHCLVVDVVKHARNTKRRLISLFKAEERQAVDRMRALFHGIECNEDGPEGDYRRRLYRLNKLL